MVNVKSHIFYHRKERKHEKERERDISRNCSSGDRDFSVYNSTISVIRLHNFTHT